MCVISVLLVLNADVLTGIFYQDPSMEVYRMTRTGFRLLPLCLPFTIFSQHFSCFAQASRQRFLEYVIPFLAGFAFVSLFSAILTPVMGLTGVYVANVMNSSLEALFLAGIVPGVLLVGCLFAFSAIVSYRRKYPTGVRVSFREGLRICVDALWGLGTIAIILVGVCTGICTVTESAALAVAYSVFVTFVIYRDISIRELVPIFRDGFRKVANVMFLIAASGAFGWLLAYIRVPQMAADAVLSATGSRIGIIIMINLILLFLGMICDMGPVIIIATPVLLPIARSAGIDPIHFGIILLLNLGIGLTTPPVGAALFSVCSIGKVSMGRAVRGTLPMYGVMILVLVIVNLFPGVVLFLPNLLRGM